jgi:hypothetical protein
MHRHEPAPQLSDEETLALRQASLGDVRKRINAGTWDDHTESLLARWAEKAAGLRWMHRHTAGSWKVLSDRLALAAIGVTAVASALSLGAAGGAAEEYNQPVMLAVGVTGLLSATLQSLRKFYNAEEQAAEHTAVAKQFGSFYRYMSLQLGMPRTDRPPSDELSGYALKEYERMQADAPNLKGASVAAYVAAFEGTEAAMPDVAAKDFRVVVNQ